MATAYLLWSSSAASSSSEELSHAATADAGNLSQLQPEAMQTRAKTRKSAKAASVPKRQPQRGLGVAQLEQLRIQDAGKKIPEGEFVPLPGYDCHLLGCGASAPPIARYGAPVAYGATWGDVSAGICYLPRCRLMSPATSPYGGASGARSVLHDQYALDRMRLSSGDARFPRASPISEPPSNQMVAPCLAETCKFCTRKKRPYGEDLGFNGSNGHENSAADPGAAMATREETMGFGWRMGKLGRERQVMEYEFFPQSASHGDSEFGDQTTGDAPSSTAAAAASTGSSIIDLTLKLSY